MDEASRPEKHPVQVPLKNRHHGNVIPDSMAMAAYEVYCEIYSPQPAMITGGCRGGFHMEEVMALLYARAFPKTEWRARTEEAFKGMKNE